MLVHGAHFNIPLIWFCMLLEPQTSSHASRPRPCTPPALQDCFDLDAARRSYFGSLFPLNPGGIIPAGPTAADLQLDTADPGRGTRAALGDVFHLRAVPGAAGGVPAANGAEGTNA